MMTIRIHADVFAAPRWLRTMSAIVRTQITRRIRPSSPPTANRITAPASSASATFGPSSGGAGTANNGAHRCVAGMPALRTERTVTREARPVLRADRPGTAPPDGGREPPPPPGAGGAPGGAPAGGGGGASARAGGGRRAAGPASPRALRAAVRRDDRVARRPG